MDVFGEVVADGGGGEGDAGSPLADEVFDVGEAVVAGVIEVGDELGGGGGGEGLGAGGPDGGNPGETGAGVPLMGEVEPEEGAGDGFDAGLALAGEEGGVADEEGGVGVLEHGDGVCGLWEEYRIVGVEAAEEDVGVGDRGSGGSVGGDGAQGFEGKGLLDEEEDGVDMVERGDGAAGDDGERGGEGGDGNEAEVGVAR